MTNFKFISVLLLLVNTSVSFAAGFEEYSNASAPELRDMRPYTWLYQQIMPSEEQKSLPARTEKSFKVHLQDSYGNFPKPEDIRNEMLWQPANRTVATSRTLTGQITYVGFFKKTYRYDVVTLTDGSKIMRVKLHFKNATVQDLEQLKTKLQGAENLWNDSRWPRDFNYSFKFQIVATAAEAHFSVTLKDKTRGPYDTYWSRGWGAKSLAHEVGHMFGLGDEYETLTGRSDCLEFSLMCGSSQGHLLLHNYYFVLRRLVAVK